MKRGYLTAAAIVIAALGVGVGLGVANSKASSPAVSSPPPAVVMDCAGQPAVRPRKLTLACADGNDYLTGLSWASWGQALASATGVQEENDCVPYCAAGHFHGYPVLVVLWRDATVTGHPGQQRYTRITLLYPGARPEVYNGSRWVRAPESQTMTVQSGPN
jgi:hypothetical protein